MKSNMKNYSRNNKILKIKITWYWINNIGVRAKGKKLFSLPEKYYRDFWNADMTLIPLTPL